MTGPFKEVWTVGEDEELRGDFAVSGISIGLEGETRFGRQVSPHINAVECYGRPLKAAQERRDHILRAVYAATATNRHHPSEA